MSDCKNQKKIFPRTTFDGPEAGQKSQTLPVRLLLSLLVGMVVIYYMVWTGGSYGPVYDRSYSLVDRGFSPHLVLKTAYASIAHKHLLDLLYQVPYKNFLYLPLVAMPLALVLALASLVFHHFKLAVTCLKLSSIQVIVYGSGLMIHSMCGGHHALDWHMFLVLSFGILTYSYSRIWSKM